MHTKNRWLLVLVAVALRGNLQAFTIKNNTNYPAQVELTLIYQTIDEKYHEKTIQLNFTKGESKDVPVGWVQSIRALVNDKGTNKATPVVNGRLSTGQRSGLAPSWIISPAQENQYGQDAYTIQMVP